MLAVIELVTLIVSLQGSLVLFINSSFLEQWVALPYVGLVYVAANILNVLVLMALPRLLRRFGHLSVLTALLGLTALALVGLALGQTLALVLLCFLVPESLYIVMRAVLDLYVEEYSPDERTGWIRGLTLTIINLGGLAAPLLIALLAHGNDYTLVFYASGVATLIALTICILTFRRVPEVTIKQVPIIATWRKLWHDSDHRNVYLANFVLQFFFAWMTIYMPIYLHTVMHFSWSQIGIIFFIMLLPYVLLELPLGRLADKRTGEKELLIIGFVIIGLATISLSFITSTNLWVWAVMLFVTRLGSATVESMSEIYFFKHVAATDAGEISLFRDTKPVAYILGPLAGALTLVYLPLPYLFIILGSLTLSGIYFSSKLTDTR